MRISKQQLKHIIKEETDKALNEVKDERGKEIIYTNYTRARAWGPISKQLRNYGGRYSVVNAWAFWCGPCKKEMPYFKNVISQLSNVQFFSARSGGHKGMSDKSLTKAIMSDENYSYLQGPKGKTEYLSSLDEVGGVVPQTFLYRGPRLIKKHNGAFANEQELVDFLVNNGVPGANKIQASQPSAKVASTRLHFKDKDGEIKIAPSNWRDLAIWLGGVDRFGAPVVDRQIKSFKKRYKDKAIYINFRNRSCGYIAFKKTSRYTAESYMRERTKGKTGVRANLRPGGLMSADAKYDASGKGPARDRPWPRDADVVFVRMPCSGR